VLVPERTSMEQLVVTGAAGFISMRVAPTASSPARHRIFKATFHPSVGAGGAVLSRDAWYLSSPPAGQRHSPW
jgi:hypothetical protein